MSRLEYIRSILVDRHRVPELEERVETKQSRTDEPETQLASRSQPEEKIEELPATVREVESEPDAPFFSNWSRWVAIEADRQSQHFRTD